MAATTRQDDETLLDMLHFRDFHRNTSSEIAARFGKSRGAVSGAMNRVDHAQIDCKCRKKGNRNGDLKPRWWK